MLVRTPKDRSRSSSICNIDAAGRDFVELISDDPNVVDQVCKLIACKSDTAGLLKTWFSVKNFTEEL